MDEIDANYDALAAWYDLWLQDYWTADQPGALLSAIITDHFKPDQRFDIQILDCACGTGQTFIWLTQRGFNVYGADGSAAMLQRAEENCLSRGIVPTRLVAHPIQWTDQSAYIRLFGTNSLDTIILMGNSFCHLPPQHRKNAVEGLRSLLRQGGLLLIDTKRFSVQQEGDATKLKEQQFLRGTGWIERIERKEARITPTGVIEFHTRLAYDTDPKFDCDRITILLTT